VTVAKRSLFWIEAHAVLNEVIDLDGPTLMVVAVEMIKPSKPMRELWVHDYDCDRYLLH
jgi:hypothetical protein